MGAAMTLSPECVHHWAIPSVGKMVQGRCERCGAERTFCNEWGPEVLKGGKNFTQIGGHRDPVFDTAEIREAMLSHRIDIS